MPKKPSGHYALIDFLVNLNRLSTPEIISAFKAIDRADFVRDKDLDRCYIDSPLAIGYGQTISQPSTVAFMLELLSPQKKDQILDIGSGSGWTTALLAHIVGQKGEVTGKEIISELVDFGRENLEKYPFLQASITQAEEGVLGKPNKNFDKILVSAAAKEFPQDLLSQLKNGGSLVIPIQNSICLYKKDKNGRVTKEEYPGFVFVPLKSTTGS